MQNLKMQAILKTERSRLHTEHVKIIKTIEEEFCAADQSLINYYKTFDLNETLNKIPLKIGSGSVAFCLNTITITKPGLIFDADFGSEDIFLLNQNFKFFKHMIE